ncbi:MAG: DUF5915 domain-containing protein [Bacteroidales bacterium]
MKPLILNEVNVKDIEYITDTTGVLVKKIKPNFKSLGPRYGKLMKEVGQAIAALSQEEIARFEREGTFSPAGGGRTGGPDPGGWKSCPRTFQAGWWPTRAT